MLFAAPARPEPVDLALQAGFGFLVLVLFPVLFENTDEKEPTPDGRYTGAVPVPIIEAGVAKTPSAVDVTEAGFGSIEWSVLLTSELDEANP